MNGTAHTGLMHCMGCNGQGYIPSFPFPTVCPSCNGESVIRQNLHKCKECVDGYLKEPVEVEIKLDSGTSHNQKLQVNHELMIIFKHQINENEEYTLKIKNKDIYAQIKITIEESILGFKKIIKLSEKESTITLKSEKYFNTKEPWVIKKRGIVQGDDRGNLVVKFVIEGSKFEKNLIKFRKAFEKIFA
jgi:DnaJ-class molecular chaperone